MAKHISDIDLDEDEKFNDQNYPGQYLGLSLSGVRAKCIGEGECWVWTGYTAGNSKVPMFSFKRKMYRVRHAIAHIIGHKSKNREGVWASTCGVSECVHPRHMVFRSFSSHAKSMAQALANHTTLSSLRNAKLARNAKRKISFDDAAFIAQSEESTKDLAARFSVSECLIRRYRNRKPAVAAASVFSALAAAL